MRFFPLAAMLVLAAAGCAQNAWPQFGGNAQHSAVSPRPSQRLASIVWQTAVDLDAQYSSGGLLIHYGSPLVTAANTVIVPVKTGAGGGFRVEARDGASGVLKWSATSDYTLPPHNWTPPFAPALASGRLYFPGAGGTVDYRDDPDSAAGNSGQIAFYGSAAGSFENVEICTPLTADLAGNLYFGFTVSGPAPAGLSSGIARISASGDGSWISAAAASRDSTMTEVRQNAAPALSPDQQNLYVAISNGSVGYLVELDAATLAPITRVGLRDPVSDSPAWMDDDSSSSPTVGPDGDVYFGVLEAPPMENDYRGWLLHFNATLTQAKTPGSFGWDDTASVVPAAIVPSYRGSSAYLLMTKYNDYLETGGTGQNQIAILDPNAASTDPINGAAVMQEVLTALGPTADPSGGVKEWCINSAAVDTARGSVLVTSEDGNLYRWDVKTNTLVESITLSAGLFEAYTPTVIAPDGKVYAISNAVLFAVGEVHPRGRLR